MKSLKDLALARESCRSYADKPVSHADLIDMLETAIMAPTANNRQSWRFALCEGETAGKIGALCQMIPGNNAWADRCPAFIVISSTTRVSTMPGGLTHEFPVADAGIAAAYLCLAATEKGLSTCIVGSADEQGVKELLGIDPERRVHLIIAVGYATEPPQMHKDRLPFDELVQQF